MWSYIYVVGCIDSTDDSVVVIRISFCTFNFATTVATICGYFVICYPAHLLPFLPVHFTLDTGWLYPYCAGFTCGFTNLIYSRTKA